nr:alpha/beta fold hydrolase [Kribbella shirazensis]
MHTGTSGPSTWSRFVPEFQALGYRVHCPTLLGHGQAPRRRPYLLDDFRDQVLRDLDGLGRFTIVGNSLGAFVASAVAVAAPDRVERLLLEELPVPPPAWWFGLSAVTAPALMLAGGPRSHLDQDRFALVADSMPSATVSTIAAGHRIHTRAPDRWLDAVRGFLAFKCA